MAVKIGLILCLVAVFNSAETGSERGHEAGSETYGNISPMNIRQRKLSCGSEGGQCTKKKQTCPIWLPLEKPYGRPYCRRRQRCCYRDSCPNPIFEYFHVCATCSSPEDALAFVIELWGQPSTNPRNTTVFDGLNITYDLSQDYNQPSCRSSFVDTWDCFQNSDGYWTECLKRNGPGPGGCSSDHALKNGHLFPEIACYYKEPPTTPDPLVPGPLAPCPLSVIDAFRFRHVCPTCTADGGGAAVLAYVNSDDYGYPPNGPDDSVLIFGLTLTGDPIRYALVNDACKCGYLVRVPVWVCDNPTQEDGIWRYGECSRAANVGVNPANAICFVYANLDDGEIVPNSLNCTND